ncbi:MAG: hypothetical protein SGJ11_14425 [Phycisphaerae bacterium]|nr:hypothetical protein [Phycisphaerae bacterium]
MIPIGVNNCIFWGSTLHSTSFDVDPLFVDASPTTAAVLLLRFDSPCLNRGSVVLLPLDLADVDDDFDVGEVIPLDVSRQSRQVFPNGCVDVGAHA